MHSSDFDKLENFSGVYQNGIVYKQSAYINSSGIIPYVPTNSISIGGAFGYSEYNGCGTFKNVFLSSNYFGGEGVISFLSGMEGILLKYLCLNMYYIEAKLMMFLKFNELSSTIINDYSGWNDNAFLSKLIIIILYFNSIEFRWKFI